MTNKYSRGLLLTIVLLILPFASACAEEGQLARALPEGLANGLRRAIGASDIEGSQVANASVGRLKSESDRLSELQARAENQGQLTREDRALIDQAAIAQRAATDIRQTVSTAGREAAVIPGAAKRIADESNPGGDAFVTAQVEDAAQKILPAITCDLAWSYMTPQEHDHANAGDEQRSVEQVVQDASVGAVENYVSEVTLRGFSQAALSAFQWTRYATGLVDKAHDLAPSSLSANVTLPNGAMHTRAAYFYARLCLRPPV